MIVLETVMVVLVGTDNPFFLKYMNAPAAAIHGRICGVAGDEDADPPHEVV